MNEVRRGSDFAGAAKNHPTGETAAGKPDNPNRSSHGGGKQARFTCAFYALKVLLNSIPGKPAEGSPLLLFCQGRELETTETSTNGNDSVNCSAPTPQG